jgi:hypothetical protein
LTEQTDIRSWPAGQRAAHYQQFAMKLRDMAAAENASKERDQLIALAEQYQELAISLQAKAVSLSRSAAGQ